MDTVTLEAVEIVRAGVWASQLSGRVPITGDDLDAMVQAAADPEMDHAPVRIGHVDPRFDGEPALGWLTNVRRVGDRVVADIADVPAKLASVVKSAFRRRSAEILWGVKTPSGRRYKAALSGLALLGVTPPAVKGLADVLARYSGPTNESESTGTAVVIDGVDDPEVAEAVATALSAIDRIPGVDISLLTDALDAASRDGNRPGGSDHGQRERQQSEGSTVNDEQIRTLLGLAADAPVTDQMRAVAAQIQPAPAGEGGSGEPGGQEPVTGGTPAPAADPPTPEPVSAPTVTIDAAALEVLQSQAAAGAQALQRLDNQDRERELTMALSAGRIAPASVEQYRRLWNANRDDTRALLSSLPQVFSTVTTETGSSADSSVALSGAAEDDAWAGFMDSLGKDFAPGKDA